MRVVVNEFMSVDGVVQAPGGPEEDSDGGFAHGGWSHPYFDVEVMGPAIGAGMANAEALLFGRRTWQGMAAAWPGRAGDPYADQMNAIRKYVVSRTLTEDDLTWNNTTLLPGDAPSRTSPRSVTAKVATSWSGAARASCGRCSQKDSSTSST